MQLIIGNKNYSSWSMRPWVLMKQTSIAFEEVKLRFDGFEPASQFKTQLLHHTPTGKVPVLLDGDLAVWDTLAISEYLAEKFPEKNLWPQERVARARARSLCAEMHSGFGALRRAFPMNIEAHLAEVGQRMLLEQPSARADLDRIVQMWSQALAASSGPFLFGPFCIADAYYAPVVMRMRTYELPLNPAVSDYAERVCGLSGVRAWVEEALAEKDFLQFEEPYRTRG